MPEPGDRGLYVYGVVASVDAAPPGDARGMDGHPLELVSTESLGALVTEVSLPRPPGRRRDLMSHSDVLNVMATEWDVVPVRFGTVFPSRDEVVDKLLTARSAELTALLERVGDATQFNLRATYVEERVLADVVRADPEIRRLKERTERLPAGTTHPEVLRLGRLVSGAMAAQRREDSAVLAGRVLPLVKDSRVRERSATDHVLDLALLVDRAAMGVFEEELEELAGEVHERIRLQLTGPLAPFDFLEGEPWG